LRFFGGEVCGDPNPTGRAGEINEFAGLAGMVLAVADDTELARSRALRRSP